MVEDKFIVAPRLLLMPQPALPSTAAPLPPNCMA
jgi:hypothetical protein